MNREGSPSAVTPKGWFPAGSHPQNYEMGIDAQVKHSGTSSACIRFTGDKAEGFGTLMQVFSADDYLGKRVRMSAWMKTEGLEETAQLWFRLDGEKRLLGFDNMDDRPVRGTTNWKKYDLTLDVPEETINIAFGFFVVGKGQAWADDFLFEVVGQEVDTTNMLTAEEMDEEVDWVPTASCLKQPSNLGFEDGAEP